MSRPTPTCCATSTGALGTADRLRPSQLKGRAEDPRKGTAMIELLALPAWNCPPRSLDDWTAALAAQDNRPRSLARTTRPGSRSRPCDCEATSCSKAAASRRSTSSFMTRDAKRSCPCWKPPPRYSTGRSSPTTAKKTTWNRTDKLESTFTSHDRRTDQRTITTHDQLEPKCSVQRQPACSSAWPPARQAAEPKWKKHDINPKSIFESAAAFDIDGDGDLDLASGDTWYEAPEWTPHHIRDVEKVGTYMNCFSTLPMDVDGDGDLDFISCSYFGKNVGWVENPGAKDKTWTYHEIDTPGPSEAAVLVDLTGDGKLGRSCPTPSTWWSSTSSRKPAKRPSSRSTTSAPRPPRTAWAPAT